MKISIIIPVYNVEQYLAQCLDSVLEQDIPLSDYEIIIVNDGSTDGSLRIAESYVRSSSVLKLYSQDNKGLSAARNTGLQYATGDYIWFIDSDDFIEKNCLKQILNTLYDYELEGLRLRSVRYVDGENVKNLKPILRGIVTGKDCIKNRKVFVEAAWLTIYKKKFLEDNHLRFMEGVIHEDSEFTPKAYYYMKRLAFLNKYVYYYRKTPKSLLTDESLISKRFFDLLDIASAMQKFCVDVVDRGFEPYYNNRIAFVINGALDIVSKNNKNEQDYFNRILFRRKRLFRSYLRSTELLLKIEGILMMIFPHYSINIYKLLQYKR